MIKYEVTIKCTTCGETATFYQDDPIDTARAWRHVHTDGHKPPWSAE